MNERAESDRKRFLFNKWLNLYFHSYSIPLFKKGENLDANAIQMKIKNKVTNYEVFNNSIYMLLIELDRAYVPVYIGKSKNPLIRWNSHIKSLINGKGSYQRWRSLLLAEDETVKYPAFLVIIPDQKINSPVIPGFPSTVGAVEYQLISLASDVYPEYLLNLEGNRR